MIVIVGLNHSFAVALVCLGFLILIHKLEYFLNARIIGTRISARAWELLIAMLVMEAAFGLAGIIAAPIYYAYLKDELSARMGLGRPRTEQPPRKLACTYPQGRGSSEGSFCLPGDHSCRCLRGPRYRCRTGDRYRRRRWCSPACLADGAAPLPPGDALG